MTGRRELLASALPAFAIFALLKEAAADVAPSARAPAGRWIARQDELARSLTKKKITQVEWHDQVNALARDVDVGELAFEIRRARTRPAGDPFGHDPKKRFITFLDEDEKPLRLSYGAALFTFDKTNVITPHAHKHMASAHMVLEGKIRVRTFDRIADEDGAILILPTGDTVAEPGHAAAMTGDKDNVHWFAPRSPHAMTFDVIVDGLDSGQDRYVIQPLDPLAGERLSDSTIRAPLLSFEESSKRYTAAL
jgi:quercetin dioxygenase-like cupin family protein